MRECRRRTKAKDVANNFGSVYALSAPFILGELHKKQLARESEICKGLRNPTVLVVGPGGYVLPYSCKYEENGGLGGTNRERIKQMIGDGKIVLADYVVDGSDSGLICAKRTLDKMGFYDSGFFRPGTLDLLGQDPVNVDSLPKSSISMVCCDLRRKLPFKSENFNLVSMVLSAHHAYSNNHRMREIFSQVYDKLSPRGAVVLGEGMVDMSRPERKILEVGNLLCGFFGGVLLVDNREGEDYSSFHYFNRGDYTELPVTEPEDIPDFTNAVYVTPHGNIRIPRKFGLEDFLFARGYNNIFRLKKSVLIPLIDSGMPKDKNHILEVDRLYSAIIKKTRKFGRMHPHHSEKLMQGINTERAIASKGLVEHYRSPAQIVPELSNVGFRNILVEKCFPFALISGVKLG